MVGPVPKPAESQVHRRFRFSLRTLLVVFVIASFILAAHVHRMKNAQRQSQLVQDLLGDNKFTNYEYTQDENWNPGRKSYPNWLERWVGEDYLYNVDCVVIADRDNPVELIEKAVQLPYLRLVKLPNCTITDENLRLLQNLKRLEWLELYRTPTTDTGVAIVAKIPSLKILDLRGTNVTDGCLADIESMKGLRSLYVGNTAITSQGIAQIAKALPECRIDSTMR
jgi:hypothetical protein